LRNTVYSISRQLFQRTRRLGEHFIRLRPIGQRRRSKRKLNPVNPALLRVGRRTFDPMRSTSATIKSFSPGTTAVAVALILLNSDFRLPLLEMFMGGVLSLGGIVVAHTMTKPNARG